MKRILAFILGSRRKENSRVDKLYYLYGIKPIRADRRVIDECTVTK